MGWMHWGVWIYKCINRLVNRLEFCPISSSTRSFPLDDTQYYSLRTTSSSHYRTMHSTSFIAFLAALPATLACLAETTLPASTGSQSLSEPQYIASGETFDGEFVKASFLCIQVRSQRNHSADVLQVRPWYSLRWPGRGRRGRHCLRS